MASVLQLVGLAAVVAGAALIAPAAGLIVGGLFLTLIGIAVESRERGGE
jgi:hypothetical protein